MYLKKNFIELKNTINDFQFYEAIIITFFGFLIFLSALINKIFSSLAIKNHLLLYITKILDNYYVLFIFFGLLFLIIGLIMLFLWTFNNKKPYEINKFQNNKKYNLKFKKTIFSIYLFSGVFFVYIGFLLLFYFKLSKSIRFIGLCLSSSGLILLVIGLYFFLKYTFFQKN